MKCKDIKQSINMSVNMEKAWDALKLRLERLKRGSVHLFRCTSALMDLEITQAFNIHSICIRSTDTAFAFSYREFIQHGIQNENVSFLPKKNKKPAKVLFK